MARRILLIEIGSGLTLKGLIPSVALYGSQSGSVKADGGVPPYSYTITAGMLPDGVYLDRATGQFSGSPTEAGDFPITVKATDLSGASIERAFVVTVIAEPLTLSGAAPDGTVGVAQSYTYAVAGGIPPYTFDLVDAPPGWSVPDPTLPTITYNADAAGNQSWIFRATDAVGTSFEISDSADFIGQLDSYWDQVTSLVYFDGANESTSFPDQKTPVWTRYGVPVITTDAGTPFGPGSSGFFSASGDYIQTPGTSAFDIGAGDFTVEAFCRVAGAQGADAGLVGKHTTAAQDSSAISWLLLTEGGRLGFSAWSGTTQFFIQDASALGVGQWRHVAAVRHGNYLYLFKHGVMVASRNIGAVVINASGSGVPVSIGSIVRKPGAEPGLGWNGYIKDVRITKGVARYTADFTPPSSQFPSA